MVSYKLTTAEAVKRTGVPHLCPSIPSGGLRRIRCSGPPHPNSCILSVRPARAAGDVFSKKQTPTKTPKPKLQLAEEKEKPPKKWLRGEMTQQIEALASKLWMQSLDPWTCCSWSFGGSQHPCLQRIWCPLLVSTRTVLTCTNQWACLSPLPNTWKKRKQEYKHVSVISGPFLAVVWMEGWNCNSFDSRCQHGMVWLLHCLSSAADEDCAFLYCRHRCSSPSAIPMVLGTMNSTLDI